MSDQELADVHIHGFDMTDIVARGARMVSCWLVETVLERGCFDECLMAECDLERSNLRRSRWVRAVVARSSFDGALLTDAVLDRAMFVECDFRGADLSAEKLGRLATTTWASFVRCDLRETRWAGRLLGGVRFVDCKMHGVHGTPIYDHVEIEGTDLSARGDGSLPATAAEVLREWRR